MDTEKQRILVDVEQPEERQEIGRVLSEAGYAALEPEQGDQADMVIFSLRQDPSLNRQKVREWRRTGLPVMAVSDLAQTELLGGAVDAGATDYILRPLVPARLRLRLAASLALRGSSEESARRERALTVMLELTQTLVSSLDFQDILYTMVSRIAEVVQVDRVSIVLVPDDRDVGIVVAASDDEQLNNLKLDLGKYPEIKHVLRTREPLTIRDVETHPVLDGVRSSVTGAAVGGLSLIPIVWEDEAMGVLFIRAQNRRGALTRRQLGFCRVLANATAVALRNARLLQTLRDETQRDTYARIEAEKRLQSFKQYADLFASTKDGLAVLDSDWRLLFANPGAFDMLNYAEDDSRLGMRIWDLVPKDERGHIIKIGRRIAQGDYPQDVDIRLLCQDGDVIRVNGSFAPLHDTEGAILLSFRDVTEERRTRDELVSTRNFLQSLIDASVDAIVAADMRGNIILFNEGAQKLYGHRAEDAIGKMNVMELYPGNGAREVGRMLRQKGHGGVGRLEPVRMEALDADGSIFPISLTAAWINQDGRPTATFGIFTDLRDRVRVEEQLAQAQEKLAVSAKQALVAELAGTTAHELNQPLQSVMGYSELLTRTLQDDATGKRAATMIHRETERMAEIVRKIGKLTKYETKSYVGDQKILDLDQSADDETEASAEKGA